MNSRAFNCIFTWWPRTINVRVHGPVCIPDRVNVTELCNYGSAILILFSNGSALHKTVLRKKMIIICFIYFFLRADTCASCSEPMALHNFPFITFITLAKIIISFSELRTLGMGCEKIWSLSVSVRRCWIELRLPDGPAGVCSSVVLIHFHCLHWIACVTQIHYTAWRLPDVSESRCFPGLMFHKQL